MDVFLVMKNNDVTDLLARVTGSPNPNVLMEHPHISITGMMRKDFGSIPSMNERPCSIIQEVACTLLWTTVLSGVGVSAIGFGLWPTLRDGWQTRHGEHWAFVTFMVLFCSFLILIFGFVVLCMACLSVITVKESMGKIREWRRDELTKRQTSHEAAQREMEERRQRLEADSLAAELADLEQQRMGEVVGAQSQAPDADPGPRPHVPSTVTCTGRTERSDTLPLA